jgi:hypothetical protein
MKPEARPGLGRKIVVTDEGIDPAVLEAIDRQPLKEATARRDDEPVPEFILALASGTERRMESR